MGWLGRGLGNFGSDVGRGYDINLGWKERLQQMAMENARQKLADIMGPLQVQDLQERIRQMKSAQGAGIEKGPLGELSGVTWNPQTGKYDLQPLKGPGPQAPAKITTPFEAWRAQNPNAPLEDWYKLSRAPEKPTIGIEGERVDQHGRLWYFDKNGQQWKQAPVNTKFPIQSSGGGQLNPFLLWAQTVPPEQRTYENWLAASKPPKPIPPDIQNLLSSKVPEKPTAEDSRRLADAADRVFGGTSYKQDLMGRGRVPSYPFIGTMGRAPYSSVAYTAQEYTDILKSIQQGVQREAPQPPEGFY
jgi:hypothetical protein